MADSMPTLEMLWEPHDPQSELAERFGFRSACAAGRWVAAVVAEHWDVEVDSCERIVMSDRNALAWITASAGRFVLKWSVAPERFRRSAPPQVPLTIRDSLWALIADSPSDQLPSQLVHGDFRSSNVLCAGKEVAAVIDFEEVRLDHCVLELARSAVMLGTRFRDWGPVSAEVRARFLAGYQSVRSLTPIEARWYDVLVLWYAAALVPRGDDPTGWGPSALSALAEVQSRPG